MQAWNFKRLLVRAIRALIHIANENAPERYDFQVQGANRLEKETNGSVLALDANGSVIAFMQAPWAKDAQGTDITTFFETNTNILTQVVKHQGQSLSYSVTADPWWVPAGLALKFCMKNKTCRKIAARSTKEAIKWAIENLF